MKNIHSICKNATFLVLWKSKCKQNVLSLDRVYKTENRLSIVRNPWGGEHEFGNKIPIFRINEGLTVVENLADTIFQTKPFCIFVLEDYNVLCLCFKDNSKLRYIRQFGIRTGVISFFFARKTVILQYLLLTESPLGGRWV